MLTTLVALSFLWMAAQAPLESPDARQFWFFVILMPDSTMHAPAFRTMTRCREVRSELINSVLPADALVTECSVHPRASEVPRND